MEVNAGSHSQENPCLFCSPKPPKNKAASLLFVGKGRSISNLLASSVGCSSCLTLSKNLRKLECELYQMGDGGSINLDLYFPLSEDYQRVLSALNTIQMPHVSSVDLPEGFGNQDFDEDPYGTLSIIEGINGEELGVLKFAFEEYSAGHISEQGDAAGRMAIHHGIQSCLRTCLSAHHSCREDTEPNWLPTRLVDIHQMALKRSVDIPLEGDRRYIALSHHWGTEPFLKLTRQNLARLREKVPYKFLRRTFRNAIDAAYDLGVRYLWIDSLCIIQGPKNESEWHQEAGTMASVYRNALLTFAACNAINIHGGFFENPSNEARVILSDTNNPVVVAKNYASQLDHRGWVLQEHLLAPRTVHFGDPVVWECRETIVKRLLSQPFIFPTEPIIKVWSLRLKHCPCLSLWYQTVEKYSRCALSEPGDKLVAIGGLARIFSAVMQTTYIAGLWGKHIISGLLWETATKDCKRVGHYRAPSWSWASVEGAVKFHSVPDGAVSLAFLENSSIVPVSSDLFGELCSGYIEIRGRLIMIGTSDGLASRDLIYKDGFLRVSLDDFISTDYGQMYLIPLTKIEAEERYWSLLVTQKPSGHSSDPLYRRLGLVSADLLGGQEYFSEGYAPWASVDWWPQLFYPRSRGERAARAFTFEDFEGTAVQTLRLL
ncbi:heterokaryon incompatibility protein-domain-containing protein [Xylaria castorea]|nr:heterokaryon incompatibility protein-domain-containing protein [Xylaria castorea]